MTCKWVHGRLSAYNGTPTLRLWEIGTHHLFGLGTNYEAVFRRHGFDDADEPDLPPSIERVFEGFQTNIFGDFQVCPLEAFRPGNMQPARVISAKHLFVQRISPD